MWSSCTRGHKCVWVVGTTLERYKFVAAMTVKIEEDY